MNDSFCSKIVATLIRQASFLLLLGLLISSTGCVNRATATLTPGADLTKLKTFYLIPGADDKENYLLIKSNLEKRGFGVTTGPEKPLPYKEDSIVHYLDKWMWDITPYMLELTITFRDPNTNSPLAMGNSYHTSLSRLSDVEMVEEVLTNMFNAKAVK